MAPEQAKGKSVDKRADIWAFGVVLYELLTGERLFKGEDVADTLAQVLTKEPQLNRVPAEARKLLRRCFEKDPKRRLRDIGEGRFLLDDARPAAPAPSRVNPPLAAVVVVLLSALGILVYIRVREKPAEVPVERFSITAPNKTIFNSGSIQGGPVDVSPDGRRLVFSAATADGKTQLWVRALASLNSLPLAGTEGASFPFWSADSQSIGFFADGKLKRIDAAGGLPLALCDAPNGVGGTWNREGVIVFAPSVGGPLNRVSTAGGASSPITVLDSARREITHRWPWFLPDGKHFLYWAGTTATEGTVRVASIDALGRDSHVIIPSQYNALYSQGYLLFVRNTTLMAQPFDTKRLATTADAVPVAEHLQILGVLRRGIFAVSTNGILVYGNSGTSSARLAWFDRSGKQIGTLGQPDFYSTAVRLSPDRKNVSISSIDPSTRNSDIWLFDIARDMKTRFTFDPAQEREAIWSSDGKSIVFNSNRKGHFDLYRKPSNGAGTDELLYTDDKEKYPTSFSPDAKWLLFMVYLDPASKNQLWLLPMEGAPAGGRNPVPFVQSEFNVSWGEFSPDGQWIAYASDESQRNEVYVAPFPGPTGSKRQISTAGGDQPVWRNDGKEIFYIGADRRLIAAEVISKGDVLELGTVRPFFSLIGAYYPGHTYDVSADGQRFLMRTGVQPANPEPLTVVQNWTAELKK
jgi:Tol biopolymer transport system component